MANLTPYIHFNGNTEEAFNFYKSVFGGEFKSIIRFKDLELNAPITDAEADKIMNIILPIGASSFLMGSDVPSFMGQVNESENRSKIVVNADTKEEADRLFNGLSAGAEVEVPINSSPWGSYFGMLRDRYGIEWMVNYEENK